MPITFNRILVIIDRTGDIGPAIGKAIQLSDKPDFSLHIFLINTKDPLGKLLNVLTDTAQHPHKTYDHLEQDVKQLLGDNPDIITNISSGSQHSIQKLATTLKSDIIILGEHALEGGLLFSEQMKPARLAASTHIPVLRSKSVSIRNESMILVLPVESTVFDEKLEMTRALSKKYRLSIHLVTLADSEQQSMNKLADTFIEAFDWLKKNLHCSVQYSFLKGANKNKALAEYCQQVNADLLIHSDNSEKYIDRFFPKNSKTAILNL